MRMIRGNEGADIPVNLGRRWIVVRAALQLLSTRTALIIIFRRLIVLSACDGLDETISAPSESLSTRCISKGGELLIGPIPPNRARVKPS